MSISDTRQPRQASSHTPRPTSTQSLILVDVLPGRTAATVADWLRPFAFVSRTLSLHSTCGWPHCAPCVRVRR
jgi:hypothetical protein